MVRPWIPKWAVQCKPEFSTWGWVLWSWPTPLEGLYLDRVKKTFVIWRKALYPMCYHFFLIYFCIRSHTFGKSSFCYLHNRLQGIQRSWSRWQSVCCWSMTNLYRLKHHQAQNMKANLECCDLFFCVCLLAMNYATVEKWGWFCFLFQMCKRGVMPLSSMEFVWVSGKSDSGALSNPAPHLVGACISPSFSQELFVCIFPLCVSLYFLFLWSLKS